MSDTPQDVEDHFRQMILALPPGQRLAMACDMFSTVKALMRAGILAECGGVEPPDYRERFFRRMYGQDFEPAELEKILKKIRADSAPNSTVGPK